jgi:DNA repair protein RecN (Recombination protein N)
MLRELHIKNFSIIDDITIEFERGLNVITGETGAGKSIIFNAFSLALGERAAGDIIRKGAGEAVIEAYLDIDPKLFSPPVLQYLEDSGVDTEDGLILKRVISARGKNRAYINGSIASVQILSEISRNLVDVHGQYEHQSLLSVEKQLDLLDAYGGLMHDRQEVKTVYEHILKIRQQIAALTEKDRERAQRLDTLAFQINEINAAALLDGEDQELEEEAKVLGSAGRLSDLANRSYDMLYSSESACIENLTQILNNLKEIADIDARAADAAAAVENSLPLLEETSYFLRDYKDGIDFSPDRVEQVQEKLALIQNLKRKYGNSIQEILDYGKSAQTEREDLQNSEEKIGFLKTELDDLKTALTEKTRTLSKKRKRVAKKIEAGIVARLSELSMPDTAFSIHITHEEGDDTTDGLKAGETGIDFIEFLISPNPGEDLKSLSKIVSGGELSRIMLALKGILAKGDSIPVLVFDEIDAGTGGKTAGTVARKLKDLSSDHQVICITHLPQIASYAENHLKIEKSVKRNRTVVDINRIEQDKRAAEVARMLGGEISDVSIRHAKEMLRNVHS